MNKKLIGACGAALLITAITLILIFIKRSQFTAELAMQSDAMAIVNYYQPRRIALAPIPAESQLKLPGFRSPQPLFGALTIGTGVDTLITVVLDEYAPDNINLFYVDKNNNQDLTDDGEPVWDDDRSEYMIKEVLVEVTYIKGGANVAVPYLISFYRYKNRLRDSIVAFRNGYREGEVTLKDTTYKIALLDDDLDGRFDDDFTALIIDIDRDGVLNGHTDSPEYFAANEPFNVNGVVYRVKHISPAGGKIKFALADTTVPPKAPLDAGLPAPIFDATTLDEQAIDLRNFRNQVVLLDFWAAWCKPWESDLPFLLRNYERYRERDFEIIGVSLDFDLDYLRDYIKNRGISWPQVASGAGWNSPLADLYRVSAAPKNFLIDRRGVIRYKDLHGSSLSAKIYELLNEPAQEN